MPHGELRGTRSRPTQRQARITRPRVEHVADAEDNFLSTSTSELSYAKPETPDRLILPAAWPEELLTARVGLIALLFTSLIYAAGTVAFMIMEGAGGRALALPFGSVALGVMRWRWYEGHRLRHRIGDMKPVRAIRRDYWAGHAADATVVLWLWIAAPLDRLVQALTG